MNKTDILLAVKRFGNKRKEDYPIENGQSDSEGEGVSTAERKKKRAKKAGILVPVFGSALLGAAPQMPVLKTRASREVETDIQSESSSPRSSILSSGSSQDLDIERRGSNYQGRPLSNLSSDVFFSPEHTVGEGSPQRRAKQLVGGVRLLPEVQAIPPSPSKTAVRQSSNDTVEHSTANHAVSSNGIPAITENGYCIKHGGFNMTQVQHAPTAVPNNLPTSPQHSLQRRPRVIRLVSGARMLPESQGFPTAPRSKSPRPLPKPKRSAPPTQQPSIVRTMPSPTRRTKSHEAWMEVEGDPTLRKPLKSRKNGEISLDFSTAEESTLELTPDFKSRLLVLKPNSKATFSDDTHLSNGTLSPHVLCHRHKHLACSTGDLLDEQQSNHSFVSTSYDTWSTHTSESSGSSKSTTLGQPSKVSAITLILHYLHASCI